MMIFYHYKGPRMSICLCPSPPSRWFLLFSSSFSPDSGGRNPPLITNVVFFVREEDHWNQLNEFLRVRPFMALCRLHKIFGEYIDVLSDL